jgi:hypothetical protein
MEARTLSVLRRRVGAVKGARNSGGGPVAGGRTTPSALPIAPLPRVISQRHAFVCSSLKIFAAQCWEQRGTATPSRGLAVTVTLRDSPGWLSKPLALHANDRFRRSTGRCLELSSTGHQYCGWLVR